MAGTLVSIEETSVLNSADLKILAIYGCICISCHVFQYNFGKGPKRLSTAAQLESAMTGLQTVWKERATEPLDISENFRDDTLRKARG